MTAITHHPDDSLLAAYASGSLPHPFSVVLASHISLCDQCRAALEAHQIVGGSLIEGTPAATLSGELKANVLSRLDEPAQHQHEFKRDGIYPGAIMQTLRGKAPRWRGVGMGVKQAILDAGPEGSVRLIHIPPGQEIPDHGHRGMELTLVLQGSFSDQTGFFGVGDLEVANEDLDHTPVAGEGEACICIAATDAPLRFSSVIPRLLQPLLRI